MKISKRLLALFIASPSLSFAHTGEHTDNFLETSLHAITHPSHGLSVFLSVAAIAVAYVLYRKFRNT